MECVGILPRFDCKPEQVLQALSVGQWELEEHVLGLGPVDNEPGQSIDLHVLAHEDALFGAAVNHGHDVVVRAVLLVEDAGHGLNVWFQLLTVVAVFHLYIEEPIWYLARHLILEQIVRAIPSRVRIDDLLEDES